MGKPLVSIIIPAYRRPEFLEESLKSVFAQKGHFNLEVIVVDGCPKDPVKTTVNKFPVARYVKKNKDCRQAEARNTGLKYAHGEYVAFLDADDFWGKDFLAKSLEVHQRQPKAALTLALSQPCFSRGFPIKLKLKILFLSLIRDLITYFSWVTCRHLFRTAFYLCQLSHLVFKSAKTKGVLYDSAYNFGGEDWKYVLEATDWGHTAIVPNRLVHYRYQLQSSTFQKSNLENKWNSYRQLFAELDKRNLNGPLRRLFSLYIGMLGGKKTVTYDWRGIVLKFTLVCFSGLFLINWLEATSRKPFWLDEVHSFQQDISQKSWFEIARNGATAQGSPSPLSYIIERGIYQLRTGFNYLGLQPWQYLRVQNPLIIVIALFAFLALWPAKSRTFLLLCALGFMFNGTIAYFATEMRPYSLWALLSFISLFGLLNNFGKTTFQYLALILLSFTATASAYQLVALALALLVNFWVTKRKGVKNDFSLAIWLVLAAGMAINLYYITRISSGGYPTPSWTSFWFYWRDYLPVAICGLILALGNIRRLNQFRLVAALTAAGWILLGPLSFQMTIAKTFFFDPRQYIYYIPAALLLTYLALTQFSQGKQSKILWWGLSAFLLFFSFRQTTWGFQFIYHRLRTPVTVQIPTNYEALAPHVPMGIPTNYEFIGVDPDQSINQLSEANWGVYWQYLNDIYPTEDFRRSPMTVKVQSRGLGMEIVSVDR